MALSDLGLGHTRDYHGSKLMSILNVVILGQVDALIVDDWAMAPLTDAERRAFLEICDERYLTRSTLLTSQLPVAKWHAQIGDPTGPTASWTGWYMPRTGSNYRESRCGRRRASGKGTMPHRNRVAKCFWALTPVALRAPSVSAQKHGHPEERNFSCIRTKKTSKTLDGCRSLFHTERALRRFAPL